jgi:hypothetical protein
MSTDPNPRKSIAQRAIDRAKARGVPIDEDPAFTELLDEWVRGEIDTKQMRERYLDRVALQEADRRGRLARRRARPEPDET